MPVRSRSAAREVGAALAVLAIYVFTLLSPFHQAAGLQRELAELGFGSVATWSICGASVSHGGAGKAPAEVKCPAAGIGKNEFAAVEPVAVYFEVDRLAEATCYPPRPSSPTTPTTPHVGQARAPPVTV